MTIGDKISSVHLEKARIDDFGFYLRLKSEPTAVYWSGFSSPPEQKVLFDFWEKYVADNDERQLLILCNGNTPLGYVQAVFDEEWIGLSMGISEQYRSKGYGKKIIASAIEYYDCCNDFFCFIRCDNNASKKCFMANGFIKSESGYDLFFPLDNREYTMERFEFHRGKS